MKKRVISVMVSLVMVAALLAGCGSSAGNTSSKTTLATEESTTAATSSTSKLLGISVPQATTGWTAAVQYYATKYCKDQNINVKIVAAQNTNEQANQIDQLIMMKCDAILLLPINDELATAAKKIKDAGIKLINYDRTVGSTQPDYYVAGDNPGCGKVDAEYLKEKLGDSYNVVICGVTGWGTISQERIQGYKDEIAKISPNVKILGEYAANDASQESGIKLMADILSAQPKIDAVYSVDDELANGALQAIKEANRKDIKAVAAGGGVKSYMAKMLEPEYANIFLETATYPPTMITSAIDIAVKAINGEKVDAKTIIPCDIVDKDNVTQWRKDHNCDDNAPY